MAYNLAEHIYRLKKDMPGHIKGDVIYLDDEDKQYKFSSAPEYVLDFKQLDNHSEYFEKVFINWKKGETVYYLDIFNDVTSDKFHASRHWKLIESKNIFRKKETATEMSEKIKLVLENKEVETDIRIKRDEVLSIFEFLEESNIAGIKNILNKLIL